MRDTYDFHSFIRAKEPSLPPPPPPSSSSSLESFLKLAGETRLCLARLSNSPLKSVGCFDCIVKFKILSL